MRRPLLRPVLDELATHQLGPAARVAGSQVHLLEANESPDDPPPGVIEAAAAAAAAVNRYPDYGCSELICEIARVYDIAEDRVALGAGSVALLQMLFQAVAGPGVEVLHAWRSFELYPVLADLAGVRGTRVALANEAHDLGMMADTINAHTRMVIICNPNNPTGTAVPRAALEDFLDRVPPDCLVAIDEAYREYVRDPDVADGLSLQVDRPNLVVLRTFSKAYGIAGLRVGYLIGDPYIVSRLRASCLPFSVSAVAQAAAVAALRARDHVHRRVEAVVAERARIQMELIASGFDVPRSEANFVWLRLNGSSGAFGEWCAEQDIRVRTFPGEGVRVSVGSPASNDAFLEASAAWQRLRSVAGPSDVPANGPAAVPR